MTAPEHDGDRSVEFQARRRRAGRKAHWALAVLAITFPLALFVTNGAAFGTDGISYRRSVDLDPEFCSNCGVRLKPEPELKRLFS